MILDLLSFSLRFEPKKLVLIKTDWTQDIIKIAYNSGRFLGWDIFWTLIINNTKVFLPYVNYDFIWSWIEGNKWISHRWSSNRARVLNFNFVNLNLVIYYRGCRIHIKETRYMSDSSLPLFLSSRCCFGIGMFLPLNSYFIS